MRVAGTDPEHDRGRPGAAEPGPPWRPVDQALFAVIIEAHVVSPRKVDDKPEEVPKPELMTAA